MIRGDDAGLEESLADGWFRNIVWVASGIEGSTVGTGCCSRGDICDDGRSDVV
jgi:hypothetical protein